MAGAGGARAVGAVTAVAQGAAISKLELGRGGLSQAAADRLAALTARAAHCGTAMIHLVDLEWDPSGHTGADRTVAADRSPHGGAGDGTARADRPRRRRGGESDLADGRPGPGDDGEARYGLRLVGAVGLPPEWSSEWVPANATLANLVIGSGFPLVIGDVSSDARVPVDAPVRAAGIRSYAGFPVRDAEGTIVGVCAAMDHQPREWAAADLAAVDDGAQACTALVAERRAREAAERQRTFLDTLLDSLETGVMACDDSGRIIMINRSLRRRLDADPVGETPEEWLAHLPLRRPDGSRFAPAETPLINALGGGEVRRVEHIAHLPDGSRLRYAVNGHPIIDPDGRRLGAVAVFHDVTERSRTERFRGCELAVVQALNESGSLTEAAPRLLQAVATTIGWPYAELWLVDSGTETLRLVERYRDASFAADVPAPTRLTAGEGLAGAAWRRTEPVWHRDLAGPNSPISASTAEAYGLRTALAVPIPSGEATLGVVTAFTDAAEDPHDSVVALLSGVAAHVGQFVERRRADGLQRALAASKAEYLNLVGHELRTPLTVIASYVDLLGGYQPETPIAEIQPMIEAVHRASDRLRLLIEAVLDLSALDSGRARVRRLDVDLAQVVRAEARRAEAAVAAKQITVRAHVPERLRVTGDADRLSQLVRALLDNAVAYTVGPGCVEVELTEEAGTADLIVRDTGVGIPEDERPRVFERFYRGAIATERRIPGPGLGLSLAQLVAQLHRGCLTLEPARPGEPGSTFRVRLPTGAEGSGELR